MWIWQSETNSKVAMPEKKKESQDNSLTNRETIALDKLSIYQVIRSSLLTQKICQNKLNFSEEVCGNLTQLEDTQHEVQRHVTDYEALYNTCSIVPR